MKTDLKARYLQNLLKNKKNQNAGFTLIELLVVIVIIGILAAIALPSFLNQANKARESGAKTILGSINRAQQAYRLEHSTFAGDYDDLNISAPEVEGYEVGAPTADANSVSSVATPEDDGLSTFTGTVTENNGVTEATITPSDTEPPAEPGS